ncbi:MAG: amino acid permease [Proteobacteria bacterium]|nr:amino acid permease [Pseudomonadota bacterium]
MSGSGPDRWGERLPRTLGLTSAIAVLIGTTIGSGIFRVPATIAHQLHAPGPVLLAWILGGLISLCGALTIAELAAAMPRSGGVFAYLLEAFGPLPGFLFGWAELTIVRPCALASIATIFSEYLGYFFPLTPSTARVVAVVAIACVALINYSGVGRAAAVMNVMTTLKYGALAALACLAFTAGSGNKAHFLPLCNQSCEWPLLVSALIPILYTYDGWGNLSYVSGEIKDPQRTLPLALILGTVAIIVIYLIVNTAFIYLVPLPEMAHSNLIAATAAQRIGLFGGFGGAAISAVVLISTFSGLNGSIMTGPRILFAMAERGLLFKSVARISPRFATPSVAIWLAAGLGALYASQNDFAQLASKFILGSWPFFALAVAGVFVLRRTRPDLARPYRTWGYPVVPVVFIVVSIGMTANALWTDPVNTSLTFAIIAAGLPLYYLLRHRRALAAQQS